MTDKTGKIERGKTYHFYGRAVGQELLFKEKTNYEYFLRLFGKYIDPIVYTYCYCLMPNHFHFLARVKEEEEVEQFFAYQGKEGKDLTGFQNLSGLTSRLISKQFSNWLNAYSKAFNKKYKRKGSLFIRPFKRKPVADEKYMKKLVHYIHLNPVLAGLRKKPEEYPYSSLSILLSEMPSALLEKEIVIHWFGDKENFLFCHREPPHLSGIEFYM